MFSRKQLIGIFSMQKEFFHILFIFTLLVEGIKFFFSPPLYNCWELDSPLQCSATHSPLSQPQQIISTLCFHPSNPTSCLEMLRSWPNTCHQFHIPIFTQKRECSFFLRQVSLRAQYTYIHSTFTTNNVGQISKPTTYLLTYIVKVWLSFVSVTQLIELS